jgi:endonuclease/exonuclease/phosphatase (EEP) superfamily protein YafD
MSRHLSNVLFVLLATLAMASVVTWLGPVLPAADALCHFRLHLAAAAGLLVLPALLAHRRAVAAAVVLAALNVAGAQPLRVGIEPSLGGARLKVLTLNIFRFADNSDAIRALIARENPDIVLLQEVRGGRIGLLASLKREYPWQVHCAFEQRCWTAVLSRHPFATKGAGHLGNHPAGMAWATFGPDLDNLAVASVHLRWPIVSDQAGQLRRLALEVTSASGPVLLGGDFNATAWSSVMRRFSAETGLKPAGAFTPTWPARSFSPTRGCAVCFPQLQIDHFMVGPGLRLLSHRSGDYVGSDHLPLVAEIEIGPRHGVQARRGSAGRRLAGADREDGRR